MSVKIKTEDTNWNECHIEKSFETGLQKFAKFNDKVGKLIDVTSSKEVLIKKLKDAVLEYYVLYEYSKRCYFNLKHKKNKLESENQSLKDQLEKEKSEHRDTAEALHYFRKKYKAEKNQLKKAELLIRRLDCLNDDHIGITRDGTTINVLLKESGDHIGQYFQDKREQEGEK